MLPRFVGGQDVFIIVIVVQKYVYRKGLLFLIIWLGRKYVWEAFISDNDEKDTGKKKSKRKAARDFKVFISKLTFPLL